MKINLTILILLFFLQILSSSQEDLNQSKTSNLAAKVAEEHSELYFMHGIQISKRFCYLGHPDVCTEGEVVESDTVKTSFLVSVTFNSENPDSVLFDGLEGANSKPREMVSKGFNGSAATAPDFMCRPSTDCGYAKLTGSNLEILVYTPSGYYSGTGTLNDNKLTLEANYSYRGSGAEYILEGQKIMGVE